MSNSPTDASTRVRDPRIAVACAVLLVLTLAAYLRAGFVLDDYIHLERVTRESGGAALDYSIQTERLGLRLWWMDGEVSFHFFRPLVLALLDLQQRWFGTRAPLFHAVSLALHLVNIVLCYLIARRVGLRAGSAAVAATSWGVSIQTVAAVGWVSGQSELVAGCLVLLSVYAFLRARDSARPSRWLAASIAATACGLLAKETALAAPLLIAAVAPARSSRGARRRSPVWFAVALAVVVIAYVAVRFALQLPPPPPPYYEPIRGVLDVAMLLAKMLRYAAGAALGLPVLPLVWDGALARVLIALTGAVSCVAMAWLARGRGGWELRWFFAALLPCILVMPASLYLYLPMCGVSWLMGRALEEKRRVARVWMAWLVITGVAGHLAAAGFLRDMSSSIEDARALVAQESREGCEDVVLVDAPFWAYCLPAAARLAEPGIAPRVHVVNFANGVRDAQGDNRLEWTSENELRVVSDGRRYFTSPIERFFLFGASPCAGAHAGDTVAVSCGDEAGVLRVRLAADSGGCSGHVFAFEGWRMYRLAP